MKDLFSNPIFLLVAGFFVFLLPRFFRLLTIVSLFSVGVIGLLAKSEGVTAPE
jgi:hypothetical protein